MENDFKTLADLFNMFIEGDEVSVDEAVGIMRKYGWVDEEGFWNYEEDD